MGKYYFVTLVIPVEASESDRALMGGEKILELLRKLDVIGKEEGIVKEIEEA